MKGNNVFFDFLGKMLEKMSGKVNENNDDKAITAYQLSAELALWIFTDDYKPASIRKTQEIVPQRPLPTALLTSFCRPVQIELRRG